MTKARNILAIHYLLFLALAATLAACATSTFNERLTAGYASVTAIRDSATQLLDTRKISSADHKAVTDKLAVARDGLDAAREMQKTSASAADAKLTEERQKLSDIQKELDKVRKP